MLAICIIIITIYFIILIWLSNSIYYYRGDINKSSISASIIVAAHNEQKNLPILLDCLTNQNYDNNKYEIIIVNDRSIDDSEKILKSYQLKNSNIKAIHIKETPIGWSNKKWALNEAIKISKNNIICQVDADCKPGPNWLASITSQFKNPEVGFVCGASPLVHKDPLLNNIFQMESLIQESINAGAIINNLIISCTGRNIAFRKDIFNQVDGYIGNENIMSGDDDLLLHKIVYYIGCKTKFILNADSTVYSRPPLSFNEFINQRLRYASKGLFYYKKKFISNELKIILPFLYIINLIACINILKFCTTGSYGYLFLLFLKIIPDYFLLNPIYSLLKINWNWISFIFLSIIHPFYIVTFGIISPFYKYEWK